MLRDETQERRENSDLMRRPEAQLSESSNSLARRAHGSALDTRAMKTL